MLSSGSVEASATASSVDVEAAATATPAEMAGGVSARGEGRGDSRRQGPWSGARPRPRPLGANGMDAAESSPASVSSSSPSTSATFSLTSSLLEGAAAAILIFLSINSISFFLTILRLGTTTGHCRTPLKNRFGWRRSSLDKRRGMRFWIGGFHDRMSTLAGVRGLLNA